jgi:hypothetical protein
MGYFRFRRSIEIIPGLRINLGKRGVSMSAGVKGAHVTFGKTGTRTTLGVPGTGLSYTQVKPPTKNEETTAPSGNLAKGLIILGFIAIIFLATLQASFRSLTPQAQQTPVAEEVILPVAPIPLPSPAAISAPALAEASAQRTPVAEQAIQSPMPISSPSEGDSASEKPLSPQSAPQPAPYISDAEIIAHKEYWPKYVQLSSASVFSVMEGGKSVGVARLPEGTRLALCSVVGGMLLLQSGDMQYQAPIDQTDFTECARENVHQPQKAAPLVVKSLPSKATPPPVVRSPTSQTTPPPTLPAHTSDDSIQQYNHGGGHWVNGYYRKNGTHVSGYWRSR